MPTLQELCTHLDEFLQCAIFSDYCKNGLQVEGKSKVTKIATGVSASLSTIEAAVSSQADALIVHHGLFWNADSHVIQGVKRKKLQLLLQHGISLIAYHLPLDAHQQIGNNWKAAQEMKWMDLEPFGKFNGIPIGVKGRVSPISRHNFQKQLEDYYQHPAYCALGGDESIRTVALISGGAYKSISEAILQGIDCFITGSFDEPVWHQAFEEKINFFALGHSATERIGPKALGEYLEERFGLAHEFLDVSNPF